jgi:uncharacterized protein
MSLILDDNSAKFQIRAYKAGSIQVNDTIYTQSIIVSPQTLITDWPPQTLAELTQQHLDIILTLKPDILLLGTGENLTFPPLANYGELINHGIGVEIMNTHAAARTYNALTAEDRNVVAALIIK